LGVILNTSIHDGSNRNFVDLENEIFYRLAEEQTDWNKRHLV
jgi:hypothetical protein